MELKPIPLSIPLGQGSEQGYLEQLYPAQLPTEVPPVTTEVPPVTTRTKDEPKGKSSK